MGSGNTRPPDRLVADWPMTAGVLLPVTSSHFGTYEGRTDLFLWDVRSVLGWANPRSADDIQEFSAGG